MPSSWITKSDGAEIRLAHPLNRTGMADGNSERVYDLLSDIRFQGADKTKVAAKLKAVLQDDLTTKTLLTDLPDDDEDKTTDPVAKYGELMFWEGNGPNRVVVSRSTIVESVVWDETRYVITVRRAQR